RVVARLPEGDLVAQILRDFRRLAGARRKGGSGSVRNQTQHFLKPEDRRLEALNLLADHLEPLGPGARLVPHVQGGDAQRGHAARIVPSRRPTRGALPRTPFRPRELWSAPSSACFGTFPNGAGARVAPPSACFGAFPN